MESPLPGWYTSRKGILALNNRILSATSQIQVYLYRLTLLLLDRRHKPPKFIVDKCNNTNGEVN